MNNIEIYARHYRKLGLNVTRISNRINQFNFHQKNVLKTPDHEWKLWFEAPQSNDEFNLIDWTNATGLGTTSGFKKLVVIDVDGCSDYDFIDKLLAVLLLPKNYEWVVVSGSRNGFHIFVESDKFDTTSSETTVTTFKPKASISHRFEKIEFLWQIHVVLPPSIHNTGNNYEFLNCNYPLNPPLKVNDVGIKKIVHDYLDVKFVDGRDNYRDEDFLIISSELPSDLDTFDYSVIFGKKMICVIDIETDGLINRSNGSAKMPNVVQVAWLLMSEDGVVYKKESSLISGEFASENGSIKFNNIKIETIEKIGKSPNLVYKLLISDIKMSEYVACHNSVFDISILTNEFKKLGLPDPFKNVKIICTMEASAGFCAIKSGFGDYKFPKLEELYKKIFGYEVFQQHNAESDVLEQFSGWYVGSGVSFADETLFE